MLFDILRYAGCFENLDFSVLRYLDVCILRSLDFKKILPFEAFCFIFRSFIAIVSVYNLKNFNLCLHL